MRSSLTQQVRKSAIGFVASGDFEEAHEGAINHKQISNKEMFQK